ncbi:MAG TPA: hypothetical protein VJ508_20280, partial [Saprospiraceae bacterium]|nr:hypothetical protein [Saprospiraceae bacterium]
MKIFFYTFCFLLAGPVAFTQAWLDYLPKNKPESELNFYDYQKAFNAYIADHPVAEEIGNNAGEESESGQGIEQFKRWEYNMQSQVNKRTGEFPKQSAYDMVNAYEQTNSAQRSTRNANWTSLGPDYTPSGYVGIGRINCMAFHPTDLNTFWIGAPVGGVWVTHDNGGSWTPLTDHNPSIGISDIAIPPDYDVSRTIYIATGDKDSWYLGAFPDNNSIGVLKSTDGGLTWKVTDLRYSLADNKMVNRLLMDPNNNDVLLAATNSGLYKTTDGGLTWNNKLTSIPFIDMEFHPGNFNILYGSTLNGEIYYSANGGMSWNLVISEPAAYRVELAVTPAQPDWVYAVAGADDFSLEGIYQSTNSGRFFTKVFDGGQANILAREPDGSGSGGQSWYDLCMAASPIDPNIILVGGINTWRSLDGGQSWLIANHGEGKNAPTVHYDKHNLRFRNNGDLFENNDGGIYVPPDAGTNWFDLTNGLVISQLYRLSISHVDPDEVISGFQDNGSQLLDNGMWTPVKDKDGMECLINYADNNVQYAAAQNGEITRTLDHWQTRHLVKPMGVGNGQWVTPYIIDPVDPNVMYCGYADVWKSYDKGSNWSVASNINASPRLLSLAVAPADTRIMYAANNSTIWKSTDGGSTWNDITYDLRTADANIEYITVKHDDPNTIWVAMSGYLVPGVYQFHGGDTTWTNLSLGLPSIPVYSVVQDFQSTNSLQLYASTEVGIYFKEGDQVWVPYMDGLPNVKVRELEIYYGADPESSKLVAATYGRGLWESPLVRTTTRMKFVSCTSFQPDTS